MSTRAWILRNTVIFYGIAFATLYVDVLADADGAGPKPGAIFVGAPLIALVEPGFIGPSGNALYAASFVVGAVACGLAARLETRAGPTGAGAPQGTVSAF